MEYKFIQGRDEKGRFVKGMIPWNKGLKGYLKGRTSPMKGKKHKKETKKKISEKLKGIPGTWKGKKLSKEHKRKISEGVRRAIQQGKIKSLFSKGNLPPLKSRITNSKRWKGEGNPNWNGGTSKERHDWIFKKIISKQIRERDNYTCQLCGKIDYIDLNVHHIDYNKHNNSFSNLISLCRSCHTKTNRNRDYWKKELINIIKNKYNYE